MDQKIRIAKLLTDQNICSRTQAEKWVEKKYIKANGKIIEKPEHKINPTDFILINPKALNEVQNQVTVILNKPPNYVSSFKDPKYKEAKVLLTQKNFVGERFNPVDLKTLGVVGRLDADSRGLLIYTQDGRFAKSIIGEQSHVEKEYLVKVKGQITDQKIKLLQFGLKLDGKPLKKAKVEVTSTQTLKFILTEGKNRQIRRMCGAVQLEVTDLKRIRIGDILLPKNLKESQWTFL